MSTSEMINQPRESEIEKLKRKRRGKKGSITKRIETLLRLVSESGSRTKIKVLLGAMQTVYQETCDVAEKISSLSLESEDEEWLDELKINVDNCMAEVTDYLEARRDDPPSTESITDSWVRDNSLAAELNEQQNAEDGDEARLKGILKAMPKLQFSTTHPDDVKLDTYVDAAIGGVPTSSNVSSEIALGSGFFGHGNVSVTPLTTLWPSGVWANPNIEVPSQLSAASAMNVNARTFQLTPSTLPSTVSSASPYVQFSQPLQNTCQFLNTSYNRPSSGSLLPSQRSSAVHHMHTSEPITCAFDSGIASNGTTRAAASATTVGNRTANDVDSWIDDLDVNHRVHIQIPTVAGITSDVTMAWLVQQSLPRTELPTFDGSPSQWVNFITKFRDVVHHQHYLNDTQRSLYLMQQLKGEAERSVKGLLTNDARGYILSLKRLKYLFGQRSRIAQATLMSVTQGDTVQNDDLCGLAEFYYTISDCLVTLRLLNYESDLYSSDTLRQAVRRLPSKLAAKWAERSMSIRGRSEEPNLIHFERWLEARVLVLKEMQLPNQKNSEKRRKQANILTTLTGSAPCHTCGGKHVFWKCESYKGLSPKERYEMVKHLKRCFNCFKEGHSSGNCSSRNTCFSHGCNEKHHTTLHEHFFHISSNKNNKRNNNKDNENSTNQNSNDNHDQYISNNKTNPSDRNTGKSINTNNVPRDGKTEESIKKGESKVSSFTGMVGTDPQDIFLQIVPVTLKSPAGLSCSTYALLDNGSQSTLLREEVARELGLKGDVVPIEVKTVKDDVEELDAEEVSITISSNDGKNIFTVESAFVIQSAKFHMPARPRLKRCVDNDLFTHLDGIDFDAVRPSEIGILIGADVPEAQISEDVRYGSRSQPLAVRTPFGWTLFGGAKKASSVSIYRTSISRRPVELVANSLKKFWVDEKPPQQEVETCSVSVNTVIASPTVDTCTNNDLLDALERFWLVDQDAISHKDISMSREDIEALDKLERETVLLSGRYQVPMLWKNRSVVLPNNISVAKRRFALLVKRLKADPLLHEKFKAVIDGYLKKGYARKMSSVEAAKVSHKTWYLPTHPVTTPNKPGKVRVVSDAAAKFHNISLNDCLVSGPDLMNHLVGVIMRFRIGPIAICSDVEEMFLRVLTTKEDSDSLRFLWKDDLFSDDSPDSYQMMVHIFGARDSATIAMCLNVLPVTTM